jgi:hypothetical protein
VAASSTSKSTGKSNAMSISRQGVGVIALGQALGAAFVIGLF